MRRCWGPRRQQVLCVIKEKPVENAGWNFQLWARLWLETEEEIRLLMTAYLCSSPATAHDCYTHQATDEDYNTQSEWTWFLLPSQVSFSSHLSPVIMVRSHVTSALAHICRLRSSFGGAGYAERVVSDRYMCRGMRKRRCL